MNGHTLEIEPGTIGCEQIDSAAFTRALNAWAKRRGLDWSSPFRRPGLRRKKKATPST